mmetsp:Transcript_11618/g.9902  ORF Transcript_11618/g.9902 Transcript_11618/m.9902 type:complete len:96 (+) Transcript_11618:200-487(+)
MSKERAGTVLRSQSGLGGTELKDLEEGVPKKDADDESNLSLSRERSSQWEARPKRRDAIRSFLLRSLGTLGIIYGDIGTSPLYTLSTHHSCTSGS